jgi:hypothetical protein
MNTTKQQYFKLNNNSNVLNKDRIIKHNLSYIQSIMTEHLDRDMYNESMHVFELRLVMNYLTDLDTLIDKVQYYQDKGNIHRNSTIVDECISGSNCESYDKDIMIYKEEEIEYEDEE